MTEDEVGQAWLGGDPDQQYPQGHSQEPARLSRAEQARPGPRQAWVFGLEAGPQAAWEERLWVLARLRQKALTSKGRGSKVGLRCPRGLQPSALALGV